MTPSLLFRPSVEVGECSREHWWCVPQETLWGVLPMAWFYRRDTVMLPPGVLLGVFGYNTQEIYFDILPTAGKQRKDTVNPPGGSIRSP